jgi:hypothetical protein
VEGVDRKSTTGTPNPSLSVNLKKVTNIYTEKKF